MKKINSSIITDIINLRKNGLSYKEISKIIKVSHMTVLKYSSHIKLSEDQISRLKENERRNRLKFAAVYAREKDINIPDLAPSLANVLGHLFFDGNVTVQDHNYIVQYTNASFDLIQKFNANMKNLFKLEDGHIYKYKGVNFDWYQLCFYSKKLCEFFLDYSSTFSTKLGARVPKEIMESSSLVKSEFLQSFWDDERSIGWSGSLTGSSTSERMIDDLVILHQEFGIMCSKKNNGPNKAFDIYINRNFENFLKFNEKAGFTKSIIYRGKNVGKRKADVLLLRLEHYRKRLKSFSR